MPGSEQLPLFDFESKRQAEQSADQTGIPITQITPETPLQQALSVYLDALLLGNFSAYTIKAFRSDLGLLAGWIGEQTLIGDIGTADLSRFLHWLLHERGIPCSPKSYARRVTSLKNFFGYLKEMRFIHKDPSTALIQQSVGSPLPEVLTDQEVEQALEVTRLMRRNPDKPDARPLLLINLLLYTGIKKGECMALRPIDFDRADHTAPLLWVRYANPRMRYKERKIGIPIGLLGILDEYLEQRRPSREVFDCTARNLEYILRDVANAAGVPARKLSFEALRWTAALTDYQGGMEHEHLRQKLGLSRVAWRETQNKLSQLAKPASSQGSDPAD